MMPELTRKLVYDDLAQLPPDGLRYELAEGDLRVTPAPSLRHQWASKRLQRQLEAYFEARQIGWVFNAPVDVILTPEDVFEPDLVVVTDRAMLTARAIEGPPTLVVEILSPSSAVYDRTTKARRYAALGVPHYWIVDLEQTTVECYRSRDAAYELVERVTGATTFEPPNFPGCIIHTGVLWTEP